MIPIRAKKPIKKAANQGAITLNQAMDLTGQLLERLDYGGNLGLSYGGLRDIYLELGYKKTLDYNDFYARYKRDPVAKAVIDRPVKKSWSKFPDVYEATDQETKFEIAWKALVKKHRLAGKFARADRMAGIGNYAVMLLGFNDVNSNMPVMKVEKASELLYIMPYRQVDAQIQRYDTDASSSRFGQPEIYTIRTSIGQGVALTPQVHWTRVLHLAEDCLECDYIGTPKLEAPFNYFENIDRTAAASCEMFWQGGLPGTIFKKIDAPGMTIVEPDKEATDEALKKYVHRIQKYLKLTNMEAQQLQQQVADPSNHVDVCLTLIAAAVGIPKRILSGSELGDLASTQDRINWLSQVKERQEQYCGPDIVMPFIERLITVGVLPEPQSELVLDWPDLLALSDLEKADIGLKRAQAIAAYAQGMALGIESIIPPDMFAEQVMMMSANDIERLKEMVAGMISQANGTAEPAAAGTAGS
jgi:hypothetical protein